MFVADHFVKPVLIGGAIQLPFLAVLFGILGSRNFGFAWPVSRADGDGFVCDLVAGTPRPQEVIRLTCQR